MLSFMRPRYFFFAFLLLTAPMLDLLTDPDNGVIANIPFGASLLVYLLLLGRAALAVLALHWIVSFIFDTDLLDIVKQAKEHPEHNGTYMIAISLFAIAFAIVIQSVLSL